MKDLVCEWIVLGDDVTLAIFFFAVNCQQFLTGPWDYQEDTTIVYI